MGSDVGLFVVTTVGAGLGDNVGDVVGDAVGHPVRDCSSSTAVTDGNCCCSTGTRVSGFKASATIGCNAEDVGILRDASLK